MNFKLSEEHEMIRKMVRDFAENEVAPTAAERDEEERFDMDFFNKMAELGLTGIPWPEKYGGIGSDYLAYVSPLKSCPVSVHRQVSRFLHIPRLQAGRYSNSEPKSKNKNTCVQWRKVRKSAHTV